MMGPGGGGLDGVVLGSGGMVVKPQLLIATVMSTYCWKSAAAQLATRKHCGDSSASRSQSGREPVGAVNDTALPPASASARLVLPPRPSTLAVWPWGVM